MRSLTDIRLEVQLILVIALRTKTFFMKKVRIKVLYLTLSENTWKEVSAVKSLRTMFTEDQRLDVTVIDGRQRLPDWVSKEDFHLVILSAQFLCARYSTSLMQQMREKFEFMPKSRALKIAMPQDDYDCSRILDSWLFDWKVDVIYSICPKNWELLYPLCSKTCTLRLGFTGYISNEMIVPLEERKKWMERTIDVVYRARKLGYNFGELGQLKAQAPNWLAKATKDIDSLKIDIQIGEEHFVFGTNWRNFLESSKFALVSPGGSSTVDFEGDLRELSRETSNLDLSITDFFQLAEQRKCQWKAIDNTMISPRNIEAALVGSVQIAIINEYSSIFLPNIDYIPLHFDRSLNQSLIDEANWDSMRKSAYDKILSENRLREQTVINEIFNDLGDDLCYQEITKVSFLKRFNLGVQSKKRHAIIAYTVFRGITENFLVMRFLVKLLRYLKP